MPVATTTAVASSRPAAEPVVSATSPRPAASLDARLDVLRSRIQEEGFLNNRGLGNEIGFYVFGYPASRELEVRDFMRRLKADRSLACNVVERNLWDVLLKVCEDRGILDKLAALEERRGSEALLERVQAIVTPERIVAAMDDWPHRPGRDVLVVSGVGQVYPFVRAHSVLENAQHVFCDVPFVLLYPGVYNQVDLKLFGRLEDSNYYRAFNII